MNTILEPVFQQLPWARPIFAWLLVSTIVLIAATLPAYFIVFPLARLIRTTFTALANWLGDQWRNARETQKRWRAEALEHYLNDHLLIHLITTSQTSWGRSISEATHAADQIRRAIDAASQNAEHG